MGYYIYYTILYIIHILLHIYFLQLRINQYPILHDVCINRASSPGTTTHYLNQYKTSGCTLHDFTAGNSFVLMSDDECLLTNAGYAVSPSLLTWAQRVLMILMSLCLSAGSVICFSLEFRPSTATFLAGSSSTRAWNTRACTHARTKAHRHTQIIKSFQGWISEWNITASHWKT